MLANEILFVSQPCICACIFHAAHGRAPKTPRTNLCVLTWVQHKALTPLRPVETCRRPGTPSWDWWFGFGFEWVPGSRKRVKRENRPSSFADSFSFTKAPRRAAGRWQRRPETPRPSAAAAGPGAPGPGPRCPQGVLWFLKQGSLWGTRCESSLGDCHVLSLPT